MTEITLPRSITEACHKLDDDARNQQALNQFLKSEAFKEAVFTHKKDLQNITIEEYSETLKTLLSFYKAGSSVSVNDLLTGLVTALDSSLENRMISRNQLRDSFIPMLREVGVIAGEKPLIWAYLDYQTPQQKLIEKLHGFYEFGMEKTATEVQLYKERKEAAAQTALAKVVAENRVRADDIKHQLDYIKKQDAECRKTAFELGIPYSQVKEKAMSNKVTGSFDVLKNSSFLGLCAIVLVGGMLWKGGDNLNNQNEYPFPDGGDNQVVEYQNGMTPQENIWRERYIELYIENNGITPAMEEEMIRLSGEYMLTMARMKEIISGITADEIAPPEAL